METKQPTRLHPREIYRPRLDVIIIFRSLGAGGYQQQRINKQTFSGAEIFHFPSPSTKEFFRERVTPIRN